MNLHFLFQNFHVEIHLNQLERKPEGQSLEMFLASYHCSIVCIVNWCVIYTVLQDSQYLVLKYLSLKERLFVI